MKTVRRTARRIAWFLQLPSIWRFQNRYFAPRSVRSHGHRLIQGSVHGSHREGPAPILRQPASTLSYRIPLPSRPRMRPLELVRDHTSPTPPTNKLLPVPGLLRPSQTRDFPPGAAAAMRRSHIPGRQHIGLTRMRDLNSPSASNSGGSRNDTTTRPQLPYEQAAVNPIRAVPRPTEVGQSRSPFAMPALNSSVEGSLRVPPPPATEGTHGRQTFGKDRHKEGSEIALQHSSEERKASTASIIHLDGSALGQWAVQHLERTLGRPSTGMTGVDPRASLPSSRVSPF
jgi:hypothetical protein